MKRFQSLVLGAALLATSALAGCGSNNTAATSQDTTLTVWARGNSVPNDVETILAKKFPEWTIKFQNIPDVEDKLRAALRSKSGLPDVVIMGGSLPSFFQVSDQFLDLSAEAKASDATAASLKAGVTLDGKQMALPTDIGPWGLFYRADAFEALGYPSDPEQVAAKLDSWEAYSKLAEAAAASGKHACDTAAQVYQARLAQKGYAYVQLKDGKEVNIADSPISRDAFLYAGKLAKDKTCANVKPYTPEWNAATTQENLIAFVGPAWEDGILKKAAEKQSGAWRVATVPGGPVATAGSFVTGLAASKFPDAARQLAAYMGGSEFQKAGYLDKGLFPSSKGVFADPEAAKPVPFYNGQDTLGMLAKSATDAPSVYQGSNSTVVSTQFFVAMTDIANTGADPATVYQDLLKTTASK
ncbi:extracellular solute-binding protein [Arthrobacter sp. 35W]|uniref:extracellular solute-binding protein n=1 Tax=Arthrobacter sp. 35W TaxID=1132441 RepID=UPI0004019866|nr:extracellular solute-binding protein [Arthrobacter sp. 35W]